MALLIWSLAGCYYNPLDLPLVDEVPIVANDRCAPSREAFVTRVIDGDTFDVTAPPGSDEELERIRMLGINAPETEKPDAPAECGADEAFLELRRRIEGTQVRLTFDLRCEGVFGRTLAYVWELDGEDDGPQRSINHQLVEEGWVRVYDEEFGAIIYQQEYERAEQEAMAQGIGLWGECAE